MSSSVRFGDLERSEGKPAARMQGFGERPTLRDLINEAVPVFGCSHYDALVWVLKIESESTSIIQSKQKIRAAINQHRRQQ